MIRYALAPVASAAAASLSLPRTLSRADGVALTFDDGPHPEGTPAVLEILARAHAQATFFLIGEQAVRRPELVAQMLAAGHQIALHGYRHRLQLRMTASEVRADIDRGVQTLADLLGAPPVWHRPPYGIYSPAGLDAARAAGMRPLLWSRWGKDWRKFTTAERIAARALRDVGPGDVILLHDADYYSARKSHQRTAPALEIILSELASREIGTVLPV